MSLIKAFPVILNWTHSMMASSGTTLAMNLPSGRQIGQLMLSFGVSYNNTCTAPAGWTKILSPTTASSSRVHAMWRICDGTEANTINVTWGSSDVHIMACALIARAPLSAPIHTQTSGGAATATKNLSTPALTTTVPNCLLIRCAGSAIAQAQGGPAGPGGANYCNWPAPMTETYEGWGNVLSTNRLGISIASTYVATPAVNAAVIATSQPSTSPNSYGSGTVAVLPGNTEINDCNSYQIAPQRLSIY